MERRMDFFLFFFQAEDGIRYLYVTGVQTCALPIYPDCKTTRRLVAGTRIAHEPDEPLDEKCPECGNGLIKKHRSEERRVGKEWSSRWSRYDEETKKECKWCR